MVDNIPKSRRNRSVRQSAILKGKIGGNRITDSKKIVNKDQNI